MKNRSLVTIIICACLLGACSKDKNKTTNTPSTTPSTNQPATKEDMVEGTWIWSSSTSSVAYDWKNDGNKTTDAMMNCRKDNTYTLAKNGFAYVDEGKDLCYLATNTFQCAWWFTDTSFYFNSTYYRLLSVNADTIRFSEIVFPTTDKITVNHLWSKKK